MRKVKKLLFSGVLPVLMGGSSAWSPASQTTGGELPLYWMEARYLTGLADAAAISQLTDRSANANHATQETADYKAIFKTGIVNGHAVARFDGSDDGYVLPLDSVDANDFTVFVVYAADENTGVRLTYCGQANDTGTGRIFIGNSATDLYSRVGANVSAEFETSTLTYGQFLIHCVTGGGGKARSWIDGGIAEIDTAFTNAEAFDDLAIGCYIRTKTSPGRSSFFDGDIAAILVYPALDVIDRDQVLSYLATTYGVTAPTWERVDRVIEASEAWEGGNCYEPTVIYDGGIYKMWYSGGWPGVTDDDAIGYATSPDGITWTKYAENPVLVGYIRSHVMKVGSVFWLYGAKTAVNQDQIDLFTSPDGITWTLDTAAVLEVGETVAWDDAQLANSFVWNESEGVWHMMYEAKDAASGRWKIGHATSADGKSWTKDLNNPVVSVSGMRGGPWIYDNTSVDSYYYLWCHGSGGGVLPTDIYRYRSTDLVTWVAYPADPVLERETADEGVGTAVGQIADVSIIVVGSEIYVYHDAISDGSSGAGASGIKLTKAPSAWLTGAL